MNAASEPAAPLSLWIGLPPLEGLLDQDDIVPNLLDTVPGDNVVLPPAEQSKKPAGARHDQGGYLPIRQLNLHLAHVDPAAAVVDIDDILVAQLHHPALLHPITPLLQGMQAHGCPIPFYKKSPVPSLGTGAFVP